MSFSYKCVLPLSSKVARNFRACQDVIWAKSSHEVAPINCSAQLPFITNFLLSDKGSIKVYEFVVYWCNLNSEQVVQFLIPIISKIIAYNVIPEKRAIYKYGINHQTQTPSHLSLARRNNGITIPLIVTCYYVTFAKQNTCNWMLSELTM